MLSVAACRVCGDVLGVVYISLIGPVPVWASPVVGPVLGDRLELIVVYPEFWISFALHRFRFGSSLQMDFPVMHVSF